MSAQSGNQIPCTAQRLSQLRPEMIQAVVPESAYDVGRQYFSERRVRIVQDNEAIIISEVAGTSGLYQQTIRLTDGTLITKCSCPSSEAPLCRHCVAVLLEYIRLSPDPVQGSAQKTAAQGGVPDAPASGRTAVPSTLGVRLREITVFLEWLQASVNALKAERALPATPALEPGEALEWVQTLQKREERVRHGEETILALRRELSAKGEHLLRLAHDLESAHGQATELQAACGVLKLDVERHRTTASRLGEIEQERDRLVVWIKDWINNTTGYFVKSVAEWERVSGENKGLPNAWLRK